jgi:hypothetical protein
MEASGSVRWASKPHETSRYDDSQEGAEVFLVAAPGREWDVDGGARTGPLTQLRDGSGPGVVGELMGGHVEDGGVELEAVLGSVAVVYVPVEDEEPPEPGCLQSPRSDRDVVEQAEPHGSRGLGVVPGWPDADDPGVRLRTGDRKRELAGGASSEPRHLETLRRDVRVLIEAGGRPGDCGLEGRKVLAAVDSEDLFVRGRTHGSSPQSLVVLGHGPRDGR